MKLYKMMIVLAILAIAGVAEARMKYTIYFRNGKEVVVSKYKESGDKIKYFRLGGWLTLPKDQIAEIEDHDTRKRRVLNPYFGEKETLNIRQSQDKKLNKIIRRQEVRGNKAWWKVKKVKKTYKGKGEKKDKRKANYAECETHSNKNLDYRGCRYHEKGISRGMRERSTIIPAK